mgnify:CR=1 FL=1
MNLHKDFLSFVKKNKISFFIFLGALIFFFIQHYFHLSWDFAVYALNGRYLFFDGSHFEIYRAPITSFILGPLIKLGHFGAYFFILAVSSFFFYSIIRLSDTLYVKYFYRYNISKEMTRLFFVFFCFNPFVLFYGLLYGSELLAISFFILFLVNFIKNKNAGYLLGLAFLTRYNFLIFFPFLFLNKNLKKILEDIGSFLLVFIPWGLFNFLRHGNWFASILDSYYLNILSRQNEFSAFEISQLLPVFNWFLLFFVIGIVFFVYKILKKNKIRHLRYEILFFIVGIVLFFDFYKIPYKLTRYTFNLFLPIAFFCVYGLTNLWKKCSKKRLFRKVVFLIIILGFLFSVLFISFNGEYKEYEDFDKQTYFDLKKDLEEKGMQECVLLSPNWVTGLGYYIDNSYRLMESVGDAVSKNKLVVIFESGFSIKERIKRNNLDKYNILLEKEDYAVIGKNNISKNNCEKDISHITFHIEDSCNVIKRKFEGSLLGKSFMRICNITSKK